MPTIYERKNYAIQRFCVDRLCITFEGRTICKYDETKDGIKEMIEDLIFFEVEDKIISTRQQKEEKATIMEIFFPKKEKVA